MASNYTENFGLCQWEATDQVLRTEFNEDNAKLDAALSALETALKTQGNTQAEQANTITQHTDAIAKLGNCQLYTTSYSGNGKYGSANKNSLKFPKQPVLMMIFLQ